MSAGKKSLPKEAEIQKTCWQWLATVNVAAVPEDRGRLKLQDYCYMVPNGTQLAGAREHRARYMASLKAQGFRPGVSDIVIAWPVWNDGPTDEGPICYHGAYIELKKEPSAYGGPKAIKARQRAIRDEQRNWLDQMLGAGYWGSIAWGFEDFQCLVGLYLAGESPPPLDWDDRVCDTEDAQ